MKRFLTALSLTAVMFSAYAADLTKTDIQDQQSDQEACTQQMFNQCIGKCDDTDDSDCTDACQENARNQCRYAGE